MMVRPSVLAVSALVTACTGTGVSGGPPAEAPRYHVGDRWVYQAKDGFRNPVVWEEIHEVTAVGNAAIHVRVTQAGPNVATVRVEQLAAPGVVRVEQLAAPGVVRVGALFDAETRRFAQPLVRYEFPLEPGRTWNQWVDNYNEDAKKEGRINRYGRVAGWEKVTTPAGTFDAIRIDIVMHLDDELFWRRATDCSYVVWYAPAVRGIVREAKEAQYFEKGGRQDGVAAIRRQHAIVELTQFTPGT
jgi:hypothetical protein